jgi:hypothetical protein
MYDKVNKQLQYLSHIAIKVDLLAISFSPTLYL